MADVGFKYLARKMVSDKILRDKTFEIVSNLQFN